jgi:hypothetical protein
MPNRLLKEGIVDSSAIDGLTPEEEVFFYRLLVVSDDFGRMDARLPILKSRCYPLKDSVKLDKIDSHLQSLVRQELAIRYQVDDKPYLQILKWEQRVRSKGKYPSADCGQVTVIGQSDDGLGKGKGKGKGALNAISFNAESNCFENIDDSQKELWSKAYPATNIDAELSKAVVWLKANPTKTKSNYNKFLSGWLSRCQDSGGTKNVVKQVSNFEEMMRSAK